jgi:hypothetical protein
MKQLALMLMLVFFAVPLLAQETEADREKRFQEEAAKAQDTTKPQGWHATTIAGANFSQVAYKDWAGGGENSLAYSIWLTGRTVRYGETTRWVNNLKAMYGQSKLGDQGIQKTDDELYFESLLIYLVGTTINPYASLTLRTQFAPGFNYPKDLPAEQISAFFDPAYMTQSAGVAYTPVENLTTRLGVGVREVITSVYTSYADDPATPEVEKTRVEGGFESITGFRWEFAENMMFITRLELFAPFKTLDKVIVRNDNTIAMKVNQFVTVNFNFQMINDVNVTPRTQMKQTLAVGLSYQLL